MAVPLTAITIMFVGSLHLGPYTETIGSVATRVWYLKVVSDSYVKYISI